MGPLLQLSSPPPRIRAHPHPTPSPSAAGRPFRVSKGGGIRREADSGGHGAKRPPGRGGARQSPAPPPSATLGDATQRPHPIQVPQLRAPNDQPPARLHRPPPPRPHHPRPHRSSDRHPAGRSRNRSRTGKERRPRHLGHLRHPT